ncbi:hypothetical protein TorRG33x02_001680 [Trema orientale]|uniref:Reverse transcriptase zinc-binding domain-containing protein n=1 Tax=Trema orientale TaxID=63057 RepID=A0A2P5G1D6_TREOI|nr:hypothetical protein TorRG33x02_001680 [Trema orientale]
MRDFFFFFGKGSDQLGGEHLVAWEVVCRSKMQGGLGIDKVSASNKALLRKWLWRYPKEVNSLWYKVIKNKYGLNSNQWNAAVANSVTFRSPWKTISSLYGEFFQHVRFKVGSGSRIRFWEDIWVEGDTLAVVFPSSYRLPSFKGRYISDFVEGSDPSSSDSTSWNFHFLRNLNDKEVPQLLNLFTQLESVSLCSDIEDRRIWIEDSSGCSS